MYANLKELGPSLADWICHVHNINDHHYCDVVVPGQKALVTSYNSLISVSRLWVNRKTVEQWKFHFKKQVHNVTISESRVFILLIVFP